MAASCVLAAAPLKAEMSDQAEAGGGTRSDGETGGEWTQAEMDERIAQEVRELLVNDPDINVEDLRVQVQDGIVTLHGRVGRAPYKHLAGGHASRPRGVRGVVNSIDVVPGLKQGVEDLPPPR